jgi:hypothetical protein
MIGAADYAFGSIRLRACQALHSQTIAELAPAQALNPAYFSAGGNTDRTISTCQLLVASALMVAGAELQ